MKRKKKGPRGTHPDAPWTEWREQNSLRDGNGNTFPIPAGYRWFNNNHFSVNVNECEPVEPFGRILWLSIKRLDRKPIHDWRDLQRIKNTLVGPEYEAIEIYPAESRMHDTANQFHLWCFLEYKIPLGYAERIVAGENIGNLSSATSKAKQRPFRGHERPADLMTQEDMDARMASDRGFAIQLVHRRAARMTWRGP